MISMQFSSMKEVKHRPDITTSLFISKTNGTNLTTNEFKK